MSEGVLWKHNKCDAVAKTCSHQQHARSRVIAAYNVLVVILSHQQGSLCHRTSNTESPPCSHKGGLLLLLSSLTVGHMDSGLLSLLQNHQCCFKLSCSPCMDKDWACCMISLSPIPPMFYGGKTWGLQWQGVCKRAQLAQKVQSSICKLQSHKLHHRGQNFYTHLVILSSWCEYSHH